MCISNIFRDVVGTDPVYILHVCEVVLQSDVILTVLSHDAIVVDSVVEHCIVSHHQLQEVLL